MKDRLLVSFSGGRTSAYMTIKLLERFRHSKDISVIFSNTGQEHDKTLEFVDKCDKHYGFNLTWIEAVPLAHGKGVHPKVVTFETADREGRTYEASVKKYGVFSKSNPSCTSRMKTRAIHKYVRQIGWESGSYSTAIGIRADEIDRVKSYAIKKFGAVYPLADWGVRKSDVLRFWLNQPFDLEIPEHYGNCKTCWKKSDRKLKTIALEHPEWFDFNKKLEGVYTNLHGEKTQTFRGYKTAIDVILEARREKFKPFKESHQWEFDIELDIGGGCGESCEVHAD